MAIYAKKNLLMIDADKIDYHIVNSSLLVTAAHFPAYQVSPTI
jgi:hypothetical protein